MYMSDGGKGSAPRPYSVSNEEYASRWDMIFRKDQKESVDLTKESVDSQSKQEEEKKVSP
jgi:hypothetical protein